MPSYFILTLADRYRWAKPFLIRIQQPLLNHSLDLWFNLFRYLTTEQHPPFTLPRSTRTTAFHDDQDNRRGPTKSTIPVTGCLQTLPRLYLTTNILFFLLRLDILDLFTYGNVPYSSVFLYLFPFTVNTTCRSLRTTRRILPFLRDSSRSSARTMAQSYSQVAQLVLLRTHAYAGRQDLLAILNTYLYAI